MKMSLLQLRKAAPDIYRCKCRYCRASRWRAGTSIRAYAQNLIERMRVTT